MTTDIFTPALGALGNTCGAVAQTLRDLGIKGVPTYPGMCPIARYLAAQPVGHPLHYIGTSTYDTVIYFYPADPYGLIIEHPLPVQQFIRAFDDGDYPDLEA